MQDSSCYPSSDFPAHPEFKREQEYALLALSDTNISYTITQCGTQPVSSRCPGYSSTRIYIEDEDSGSCSNTLWEEHYMSCLDIENFPLPRSLQSTYSCPTSSDSSSSFISSPRSLANTSHIPSDSGSTSISSFCCGTPVDSPYNEANKPRLCLSGSISTFDSSLFRSISITTPSSESKKLKKEVHVFGTPI